MDHGFDGAFWDRMYGQRHAPWDGEPNAILAREVAALGPGTALDVACGEGADALWLAHRGWTVTAVDFSQVALERAREADAEGRVSWLQADLHVWQPPRDAYDLLSSHYLHMPPTERQAFFGRLAQAVRPSGILLFVAHHPSDQATTLGRPAIPDLYFTPDELTAALAPGRWEILFAGTIPHAATDRQGRPLTIQDMVVKAKRLA